MRVRVCAWERACGLGTKGPDVCGASIRYPGPTGPRARQVRGESERGGPTNAWMIHGVAWRGVFTVAGKLS